jgi:hypothetical protein
MHSSSVPSVTPDQKILQLMPRFNILVFVPSALPAMQMNMKDNLEIHPMQIVVGAILNNVGKNYASITIHNPHSR